MKVKHKVTGKIHEVSADYFTKYEDKLQVLEEVIEAPIKKQTVSKKKSKVVTDDASPVSVSEE